MSAGDVGAGTVSAGAASADAVDGRAVGHAAGHAADHAVGHADPAAGPAADHAVGHAYITDKERYLNRLKRIEGQARGIRRMVEDEKYCIDILTQISAMTSALEAVALGLLDDHLRHCVVDAARVGGPEAEAKLAEASAAISRLVR